jgi:glycosyltransferase involved in cell wall biosynthesis
VVKTLDHHLEAYGVEPTDMRGINCIRSVRAQPTIPADATVTVVIPNYNYARYLPDAVHSVLTQRGVAVDVVIVDDASTDDSVEVARKLAAADDRILILAHRTNSGPVATFNDGLAMARGDFLVRLDADDLLTPSSLERSVAVAQHFPSVGLVYGHPLHFSGLTLPRARQRSTRWTIWPGRTWLSDRCHDGFNVITSPEVLMRKSIVDEIGGQQNLAHTHDMEMWFRVSAFSDVAYIHDVDQAWHRDHKDSLSARNVDTLKDLLERRDAFQVLFAGMAGQLPESNYLLNNAMRAVAAQALNEAIRAHSKGPSMRSDVERYVDIAKATTTDFETLREWRLLQRWLQYASQDVESHPAFFAQRVLRKLQQIIAWRRWHRSGVFQSPHHKIGRR